MKKIVYNRPQIFVIETEKLMTNIGSGGSGSVSGSGIVPNAKQQTGLFDDVDDEGDDEDDLVTDSIEWTESKPPTLVWDDEEF